MIKILIVSEKKPLLSEISTALHEIGYDCSAADGYPAAMDRLLSVHIDLILADFDAGACDLCRDLRDTGNAVPFITLIETPAAKRDKRAIFRSRADGYIETPPDTEELQMRVRNLLWRCRVEDSAVVTYGDCRLRTDTYTLETGDTCIELRRMEFLLLEKLLSYPGRVFTRAQLLDELWGYDCDSDPRTVDSHIKQLRKKLKGADAIRIQTIRGLGYRAAVPKQK